jgi:hypothetical protein
MGVILSMEVFCNNSMHPTLRRVALRWETPLAKCGHVTRTTVMLLCGTRLQRVYE